MSDREIKTLLTAYVGEEIALICEEELPGCEHIYSKSFNKRIHRMFWSEKYFGNKFYLGYAVRRIAVIIIIILSLFTANEVSARVFGFNPWKFVISFLSDTRMDVKTYTEPAGQSDDLGDMKTCDVVKDVPTQIPERFKQIAYDQDDISLYVEWNNHGEGKEEHLQYLRTKLSVGEKLGMDGEYQSKRKITINGLAGEYYVKEDETWIVWDDRSYNHMMITTGVETSEEILLAMAESLYKQ